METIIVGTITGTEYTPEMLAQVYANAGVYLDKLEAVAGDLITHEEAHGEITAIWKTLKIELGKAFSDERLYRAMDDAADDRLGPLPIVTMGGDVVREVVREG